MAFNLASWLLAHCVRCAGSSSLSARLRCPHTRHRQTLTCGRWQAAYPARSRSRTRATAAAAVVVEQRG